MSVEIPAKARKGVEKRDGEQCTRCWVNRATDVHHRLRRAVGLHGLSNLVRLCRGCHGWVHAHPKQARAAGWIIPAAGRIRPEDVPSIPVKTHEGWMLHDDLGGRERILEALALELLTTFGMLEVAA